MVRKVSTSTMRDGSFPFGNGTGKPTLVRGHLPLKFQWITHTKRLRRNPGPELPIPWFGLWWSLTLRTWRFQPSFLIAPPHAGSHHSPPLVPLMLRPLMVTPLVSPTLKAISAPLASIFGQVLSE